VQEQQAMIEALQKEIKILKSAINNEIKIFNLFST